MTMNTNLINAITNDAAKAIAKELPTFEAWYKTIAEYKNLDANANGILGLSEICDDIASMDRGVFDKAIKGEPIEETDILSEKHEALLDAKYFINHDAHYAYHALSIVFDNITSEVANGNFDMAFQHFEELKNFSVTGMSNPIECIDIDAIKNEIRSAQRECMKINAKDAANRKVVRELAEGAKNGYAIVGGLVAITADIILGVKVLKKILK